MLCWCKSLCDWMFDCLQWLQQPAGLAAAPWLGQGASPWARRYACLPLLLELRGPGCQEGECSCELSLSLSRLHFLSLPVCLPRVAGLAVSVLLQCLQMCTNKGGLKQNESKQTNGIRVMGVGGLVHSDKHNDALWVCVRVTVCVPVSRGLSVVRCVVCMAGWLLLGVFVCLPICLCFCNYVWIFTWPVLVCVINVLFLYCSKNYMPLLHLLIFIFSCWSGSHFCFCLS